MEMNNFLNIGVLTIHLQRIQSSDVLPKETNWKKLPGRKSVNDRWYNCVIKFFFKNQSFCFTSIFQASKCVYTCMNQIKNEKISQQ